MPKRIEIALPVPTKSLLKTSPDAAMLFAPFWVSVSVYVCLGGEGSLRQRATTVALESSLVQRSQEIPGPLAGLGCRDSA